MDSSYREHNDATRAQLRAFVRGLPPADLDRSLGDDWTVKAALVHMAFWDRLAASLLEEWERTGVKPALEHGEDVHLNRVCLRDWLAVPAAYALREVLEAATFVDQRAARLSERFRAALFAANESWAYRRHRHRTEHLLQMTRAVPHMP